MKIKSAEEFDNSVKKISDLCDFIRSVSYILSDVGYIVFIHRSYKGCNVYIQSVNEPITREPQFLRFLETDEYLEFKDRVEEFGSSLSRYGFVFTKNEPDLERSVQTLTRKFSIFIKLSFSVDAKRCLGRCDRKIVGHGEKQTHLLCWM